MNPRLRAVIRALVLAVNTPVAKLRMRRAAGRADRPVSLEIGGLTRREGWLVTNVNAVTRYYMDATRRWPFEDGSLQNVYADNVIEHITLDQGRALLAEAFRCLRPGGVIRLVTPDLRKHVELYLSGPDSVKSDIGNFYRDRGLVVEHPVDLVRIPIASFGHHVGYLYDADALAAELNQAGFGSARELELGTSDHEALRGMDLRSGEGGAQMAIEAVR